MFINKMGDYMKYNFNETMKELKSLSKLLKEAYVFGEEDEQRPREGMHGDEEGYEDEYMMDDNYGDEGKALSIINKIRELALDGITLFKEDVDNVYYIVFKKLFLETDKAMSDKEKGNE